MTAARLAMFGEAHHAAFAVDTAERLRRQLVRLARVAPIDDMPLLAMRHAVVDDAALAWLAEQPGRFARDSAGQPLIGFATPQGLASAAVAFASPESGRISSEPLETAPGERYSRLLRRRLTPVILDLRALPLPVVERRLFDNTYKGVTDIVTARVWPLPAFHVTRLLARLGVTPNMVTATGIALTFLASWLLFRAEWIPALAAAWMMTFLDTVDGKLARSTVTSSRIGGIIDHANDIIHPPCWWICTALGLIAEPGGPPDRTVWTSFFVIAACYVVGRICEIGFKRRFGYNQFMWRPFDGLLRRVIARRNIILLVLTAGALAGGMDAAFAVVAAWSAATILVQCLRWLQAELLSARGRQVTNWMQ